MPQQPYPIRLVMTSVIALVIGLFMVYKGIPNNGPVMCGSEVMQPGDYCGPPGQRVGVKPSSNYDEYAAEQHAASPSEVAFGAVVALVGLALLGSVLLGRRPTAPPPD